MFEDCFDTVEVLKKARELKKQGYDPAEVNEAVNKRRRELVHVAETVKSNLKKVRVSVNPDLAVLKCIIPMDTSRYKNKPIFEILQEGKLLL